MSLKSRTATLNIKRAKGESAKEYRRRLKRALKDNNRAVYAARISGGQNRKTHASEGCRSGVRTERHRFGPCGNAGCEKCLAYNLSRARSRRVA